MAQPPSRKCGVIKGHPRGQSAGALVSSCSVTKCPQTGRLPPCTLTISQFLCGFAGSGPHKNAARNWPLCRLNWGRTHFQARFLRNEHRSSSVLFLCSGDQGRATHGHRSSAVSPSGGKGQPGAPQLCQLPRRLLCQLLGCWASCVFSPMLKGTASPLPQAGGSEDRGGTQSVLRGSSSASEAPPGLHFPFNSHLGIPDAEMAVLPRLFTQPAQLPKLNSL